MAIEQRTPTSNCGRCRQRLAAGHRVKVAYVLNRPVRRMASFHEVQSVMARGDFELTHINCHDPGLILGGGDMSIDQHVPMNVCGRCRKEVKPGDRLNTAFIVEAVGPPPSAPFSGHQARLSGVKGEVVHVDCADPQLLGKVILT